jgi:hypothetical protein
MNESVSISGSRFKQLSSQKKQGKEEKKQEKQEKKEKKEKEEKEEKKKEKKEKEEKKKEEKEGKIALTLEQILIGNLELLPQDLFNNVLQYIDYEKIKAICKANKIIKEKCLSSSSQTIIQSIKSEYIELNKWIIYVIEYVLGMRGDSTVIGAEYLLSNEPLKEEKVVSYMNKSRKRNGKQKIKRESVLNIQEFPVNVLDDIKNKENSSVSFYVNEEGEPISSTPVSSRPVSLTEYKMNLLSLYDLNRSSSVRIKTTSNIHQS